MDPMMIAAGISAVSKLFEGVGSFFGHNTQARAEKNAADQAQQEAGVASSQALAQGDQAAAQGAVNAAANGGGFVGSALSSISNLTRQAMFNARAAAYRGQTEARQHLYQAKVARQQGINDLIGSLSPAAAGISKGVAQSRANSAMLSGLGGLGGGSGADGAGADAGSIADGAV